MNMSELTPQAIQATAILSIILWTKVFITNVGLGGAKNNAGGRAPEVRIHDDNICFQLSVQSAHCFRPSIEYIVCRTPIKQIQMRCLNQVSHSGLKPIKSVYLGLMPLLSSEVFCTFVLRIAYLGSSLETCCRNM